MITKIKKKERERAKNYKGKMGKNLTDKSFLRRKSKIIKKVMCRREFAKSTYGT